MNRIKIKKFKFDITFQYRNEKSDFVQVAKKYSFKSKKYTHLYIFITLDQQIKGKKRSKYKSLFIWLGGDLLYLCFCFVHCMICIGFLGEWWCNVGYRFFVRICFFVFFFCIILFRLYTHHFVVVLNNLQPNKNRHCVHRNGVGRRRDKKRQKRWKKDNINTFGWWKWRFQQFWEKNEQIEYCTCFF